MNTRYAALFVVVATLLASPLAAAPNPSPRSYDVIKVTVKQWQNFRSHLETFEVLPGMTRDTITDRLGEPRAVLARDIWLYDNCAPDSPQARAEDCDLLIVSFEGRRIVDMKFVNRRFAQLLVTDLQRVAQAQAEADTMVREEAGGPILLRDGNSMP